jgi:phenylpropionate dioxygenase-like ring-hydroxylating dioxygenase large terminal subunit
VPQNSSQKQCGSALVLGCKYHGWSYNTTGALTKAPQFDTVAGFDPAQNSLYPIAVHVTEPGGFVFVNMDNGRNGEPVKFEDWFGDLEKAQLGDGMVKFDDYKFHSEYTLEGNFNWKTLMDGYQGWFDSVFCLSSALTHSLQFAARQQNVTVGFLSIAISR